MRVPRHLWLLAPGQLISWGSLYYGITFLADAVHVDTGWNTNAIFGCFSLGLLITALVSPLAGQSLQRFGGRVMLSAGSVLAALSFLVLSCAFNFWWFCAGCAWRAWR